MSLTMASVRVVGYARLSRQSNGHGIAAQQQAIRDYCERRGLELLRIETDDGASGRSTRKRPGLAAAIEAVRSKEADAIVACRVDRLARSSLDYHKIAEQVQKAGGTIRFSEQEGLSLDSPEGRMMLSNLASFAAYEAELISARTKDALAAARRKGTVLGNPSFTGVSAEAMERIRSLQSEGLSLRAIAERLNAENVPTPQAARKPDARWHAQSVHRILKRSEHA